MRAPAASVVLVLLAGAPGRGSAQAPAPDLVAAGDTTPRREIPVAIGTLSARELGDVIATSLLGGLRVRMAGVRAIQPSGEPGSALHFRLRGATAISRDQDPLVIVDGTISRGALADIAADDVDRIEVLKGPSAAAIYGSGGAAGVILVFTRRGWEAPEGKLEVRLRSEAGPSFMTRRFGVSGAHPFEVVTTAGGGIDFARDGAGKRILEADRIADNPYPSYHDHQSQLYLTGLFFTNHLSLAWRKGPARFLAAFDDSRDEGTVFALSGFRRRNLRLNADHRAGPVEISVSGFYGWSDRQAPPQGLATFFGIRFLEPHVDLLATNPDGTPYRTAIPDRIGNASNPLNPLVNQTLTSRGKRLMGGATIRWRPTGWLAIEGSHHAEREEIDSILALPSRGAQSGLVRHGFFTGRTRITEGALVAARGWSGIRSTSRIGYVYQSRSVDDSLTIGSLGEDPASVSSLHTEASVLAAYATTALVLDDRYIVDAAVRRDVMSLLSPATRTQWYYRVAGAWLMNQDLRLRSLDELRLHAAYGTAGRQPEFTLLPLGTGLEPLRAPRSGELEVGATLATRGGRFTLDYAYSRKTTRDLIAVADIPSPGGFFQAAVNAGSVRATTHELTLGYSLLRSPEASWSIALTADRIRQQITEYRLPERLAAFGQQPPIFFIGAGKSLGVMYGRRFVRGVAELYDNPDRKALSGPGQAFDPASFVVNEEGYVVPKASWRCGEDLLYRDGRGACSTPERPIPYQGQACAAPSACPKGQLVPIGNSMPDFVVGLRPVLRYRGFGLAGLLEWSQGGAVYDGSRQWTFLEHRDPVFDQRGKPAEQRKSIEYYKAFYDDLNGNAFFVESATYLEVRELGVTYSFRIGRLDRVRVGLMGRHLFSFTGYSGYDPEVGNESDPLVQRMDWYQYPHYRTISGVVEIAF